MTYTLTTLDSRIGGVANPLDPDEHLPLTPDKTLEVESKELAEAIVDAYDEMVFVVAPDERGSDSDSDSTEDDEDEEEGEGGGEGEICGAEMNDGSVCERPADECPYHG